MSSGVGKGVTIYHNPSCGTSRNVLALIRASGIEPTIIEYLQSPPDGATLRALLSRAGLKARDVLRVKGTPYRQLGLGDPGLSEDHLVDQMLAHPILINRPIVATPTGVNLCRPSDIVLGLLPAPPPGDQSKEDGSPVLADAWVDGDLPELRAALTEAGLPTDDINEPGRAFFAYSTLSGERVGFGGFEHYGRDVLLRSIVVLPEKRNQGIGGGIVPLLMRRAFDLGARQAWLLTTSAVKFFVDAGFRVVEKGEAPEAILGSRQASSICPSTATFASRAIAL